MAEMLGLTHGPFAGGSARQVCAAAPFGTLLEMGGSPSVQVRQVLLGRCVWQQCRQQWSWRIWRRATGKGLPPKWPGVAWWFRLAGRKAAQQKRFGYPQRLARLAEIQGGCLWHQPSAATSAVRQGSWLVVADKTETLALASLWQFSCTVGSSLQSKQLTVAMGEVASKVLHAGCAELLLLVLQTFEHNSCAGRGAPSLHQAAGRMGQARTQPGPM